MEKHAAVPCLITRSNGLFRISWRERRLPQNACRTDCSYSHSTLGAPAPYIFIYIIYDIHIYSYRPYGSYVLAERPYMDCMSHIFLQESSYMELLYGPYGPYLDWLTAPRWTARFIIELYCSAYMDGTVHIEKPLAV